MAKKWEKARKMRKKEQFKRKGKNCSIIMVVLFKVQTYNSREEKAYYYSLGGKL